MTVDPTHVGQMADIFVWAEATLPPDETLYYFMLDEGLKAILWCRGAGAFGYVYSETGL